MHWRRSSASSDEPTGTTRYRDIGIGPTSAWIELCKTAVSETRTISIDQPLRHLTMGLMLWCQTDRLARHSGQR
jgi:hypothetical protein